MHKLIATGLGIGYIRKGGGTVAAMVCCGLWYLIQPGSHSFFFPLVLTALITTVGIWSATVVEELWGKDSYRVVIDEIAGMCLSLLFIPINAKSLLGGLVLFRLFDIAKPFGIRKLEKLRGGVGSHVRRLTSWTIHKPASPWCFGVGYFIKWYANIS